MQSDFKHQRTNEYHFMYTQALAVSGVVWRMLFVNTGQNVFDFEADASLRVSLFLHPVFWFLPERDFVTFGSLLSQFRLSVVCNVGAPYSRGWSFRQYFFHPLTSVQSFTETVLGEPSVGSIERKRGINIQRCWTYRRLYLINGTR